MTNEQIARALFGTLLAIRDLGSMTEVSAWNLANMAQCAMDKVAEALDIDTTSISQATRLKEEGLMLIAGTLPPSE